MRILDRYIVRHILAPFALGLLIFTFLFIINPLREYAEPLLAKGVPLTVVLQLIGLLLPSALALTIPLSLLLGLLVAFGRLSSDREFVAMQACGVSLMRLLRPVGVAAALGWASTSYMWLSGMHRGNQAFREITFNILADRAEGKVKPQLFFTDFPGLVLYVREVPSSGSGWKGVFLYDRRQDDQPAVYLARRGRVLVDRTAQKVELVLEDGSRHSAAPSGKYDVFRFPDRLVLSLDPRAIFGGTGGPGKGINEMSIAELRALIAENERAGLSTHNERIAIHWKFAIPAACLVFGLIGLALGATSRRDGALGSFVLGIVVVFLYYVPFVLGPSMAKGGVIPPWLAAWLPNMLIGALGVALFLWRDRVADQPIRLPLPAWLDRACRAFAPSARRFSRAAWLPLRIIDRYVAAMYVRILLLTCTALLAVSYIATFVDHSDKLFKGTATGGMLAAYMLNATPQYVYWILPLSVLLASLVTVAVLTKNSELIVMKACGISLYRAAWPMLASGAVCGLILFGLEESLLGPANRRAEEIRHVMNGGDPQTFGAGRSQQWVAADGAIYHFDYFDRARGELLGLQVFEFGDGMSRLIRRTSAQRARYAGGTVGDDGDVWEVRGGWVRDFDARGEPAGFSRFDRVEARLEPASYFATEQPDPRFMGYRELRAYTERLRKAGIDVLQQQVALIRKVAFPFLPLVMTLLAVPFGVTIGRSGAMAGIGVGIALAIAYWTAQSVFVAFGEGGVLAPALAAWAPNLIFGAGAAYLLLTVRT